jgi:hypothetical protein
MNLPSPLGGVLVLLLAVVASLAASEAAASRIALVIGNQNYQNLESLQKAIGDAETYAELFETRGFDRVIVRKDLTRQDMDLALAQFMSAIQPGDTAVFVYSGHGWSDGTQNYLVGVDAPGEGPQEFLKRISIPIRNGANGIIDEMQARGANLKVAIIDACRDNPFAAAGTRSSGLERGLNRLTEPPPEGTFLVFSAGAGQVALDRLGDDDASPNGLFTRTFIPLLSQDLTLLDATKATQESVYELAATAGYSQQPAFYDETRGNRACLWDSCGDATPGTASLEPDEVTWLTIVASSSVGDFESFLRLFPNSRHRAEAEQRIRELTASLPIEQAEPQPEPVPAVPTQPAPAVSGDLTRKLQQELKRVGCYGAAVDGDWGPRSRRALSAFGEATGRSVGSEPSAAALDAVSALSGKVCVAAAPPVQVVKPQPEAPASSGTQHASTNQASPGVDVSGRWQSSSGWGTTTLSVSGTALEGNYRNGGRITGSLRGRTAVGKWAENISRRRCDTTQLGSNYWGTFRITFDASGRSFSGVWSYCDESASAGNWTGSR